MKQLVFALLMVLVAPVWALDRTEADIIVPAEYPAGLVYEGRVFTLDADHRRFTIVMDRVPWNALGTGVIARARAEVSLDGGLTWEVVGAVSVRGGEVVIPRSGGQISTTSAFSNVLPREAGFVRLMRFKFEPLMRLPIDADCELRDAP